MLLSCAISITLHLLLSYCLFLFLPHFLSPCVTPFLFFLLCGAGPTGPFLFFLLVWAASTQLACKQFEPEQFRALVDSHYTPTTSLPSIGPVISPREEQRERATEGNRVQRLPPFRIRPRLKFNVHWISETVGIHWQRLTWRRDDTGALGHRICMNSK